MPVYWRYTNFLTLMRACLFGENVHMYTFERAHARVFEFVFLFLKSCGGSIFTILQTHLISLE